jgi:hypothetical protein
VFSNVTSEEAIGRLRKAMLPRACDKLATVRVQSVYVLKRLQDEDDPTDEVTVELVRLMVSDPSKYVLIPYTFPDGPLHAWTEWYALHYYLQGRS